MAQLPLPLRALFFPTRPPQTVAERHWRKFWEQEIAHHRAATFIWHSRLWWAGLKPRSRVIILGIVGLVLVGGLIAGVTLPNLKLRPGVSANQTPGVVAPVTPAPGKTGQPATATGAQAVNLQTLLVCGGAVVVGIGALAAAAYFDERQRKRRPIIRP